MLLLLLSPIDRLMNSSCLIWYTNTQTNNRLERRLTNTKETWEKKKIKLSEKRNKYTPNKVHKEEEE